MKYRNDRINTMRQKANVRNDMAMPFLFYGSILYVASEKMFLHVLYIPIHIRFKTK